MKLTTLLIMWAFFVQSQNNVTVSVHYLKPDTVCAGQDLNIYFTLHDCQPGQYSGTTAFKMYFVNQSTFVWQGHYLMLNTVHSGDTLVLTIKAPKGYTDGPAFISSDGSMADTEYFNCVSTGLIEHLPNNKDEQYYDLYGNKTPLVPNTILIKSNKKLIIQN